MKYSCDITIDLPRDRVVELMDNLDNMCKWQDGLQKVETLSGEPGTVGSKLTLHHKMGKKVIQITETMTEKDLPDRISFIYEADGVYNPLSNTFTETEDGRTNWHIDTEFQCKGFIKIMSWLMPGMFKKQTMKMMRDFKSFAEAEAEAEK